MPLHEWNELTGWDGLHHVWIVELLYWVKSRLPAGYKAYIGTTPTFAVNAPPEEEIAVVAIEGPPLLLIERHGQLIAAVELVSPRNKDRPAACSAYASSYAGYLL